MTRLLVIDYEAKNRAIDVLAYASRPDNLYVVGPGGSVSKKPPGDNPNHVAQLNTYRCVFSFTRSLEEKRTYRDLSISVPSEKFPNVIAAFTIAELFGFTGWDGKSAKFPDGWIGKVDQEEHCVRILQPML